MFFTPRRERACAPLVMRSAFLELPIRAFLACQFYIAQFLSLKYHHSLNNDVKMFFELSNALFDAGIACWDCKRAYDYVRPITAVHYLYTGKPVTAWAGYGKGTQTFDGGNWMPFQEPTIVTPPFPEYVSGHSTFSAAGAYILQQVTGFDLFGDSYVAEPGSRLRQKCGAWLSVTSVERWKISLSLLPLLRRILPVSICIRLMHDLLPPFPIVLPGVMGVFIYV